MRQSRSFLDYYILSFSLLSALISGLIYGIGRPMQELYGYDLLYFLPLVVGAAALVTEVWTKALIAYRISQVLRILCLFFCLNFVWESDFHVFLLFASVLAEFCVFESHPVNTAITVSLTTAALLFRGALFGVFGYRFAELVVEQIPFAILGYLVSLFGSRFNCFREVIYDVQREKMSLEDLAVNLARANTKYQEYAVAANESCRSNERRRITRDIHDIVGYTLTNNIMLMETAIDMMQENPLGVPVVIETARSNAEEGLSRIRQALYILRRQEESNPVGIRAIHRLVRVFEEATGSRVKCELINVPGSLSEDVDSALYHLVQESLINSFRHGKADKISIVLRLDDNKLNIRVRDNGKGAEKISEGIGLKGMRERLDKLDGHLDVSGAVDGFLLEAVIPVDGNKRNEENTIVDS